MQRARVQRAEPPFYNRGMQVADPLPPASGIIDSAAYAGGVRVGDIGLEHIGEALRTQGQFVWLGSVSYTHLTLPTNREV